MKRSVFIVLFAALCLTAQAQRIIQYEDTFKLQDQPAALDLDEMLLNIVAEQGRQLAAQDSTFTVLPDSLAAPEESRDTLPAHLLAELDAIHPEVQGVEVEHALIPDLEEDRQTLLRSLRKPSKWKKDGRVLVQLTQNYTSPNWYQGGVSSFAMYGLAAGRIGYYGDRLTWENTGEWKEGFSTISGDTVHKINTTEDQLKLMTKLNFRAHKQLYYSFSGEFLTQFFPTYRENSRDWKTGTFSPIRLNLALGLDYQPVKGLSISVSPLAYKLVYAMNTTKTKVTDFSIPEGENILNEIGSSMRIEWYWHPFRELDLQTKFYMYTNYKRVELDLEVACDFIINRFLTTRLVLHPRYDNTVILTGDEKARVQFKELLSIGFSHKFR